MYVCVCVVVIVREACIKVAELKSELAPEDAAALRGDVAKCINMLESMAVGIREWKERKKEVQGRCAFLFLCIGIQVKASLDNLKQVKSREV